MKNKKGFTLIEILTVIIILISLTSVVIVTMNNVSIRQKEKAYNEVVKQIETAAKDYFTSNEFLFEGLTNGSYARISLGRLVNEDYLNTVVDPRNGGTLPYCSYVEVKKENNKFVASYKKVEDNSTNCDTTSSIIVSEPEATKATLDFKGTKFGDWFTSDVDSILTIENNSQIKKIERNIGSTASNITSNFKDIVNVQKDSNEYKYKITDETKKEYITYLITNKAGKKLLVSGSYSIDKISPVVNVEIKQGKTKNDNTISSKDYSESWNSNNVLDYVSNTWTNKEIIVKSTYTESNTISPLKMSCKDSYKNEFVNWKRYYETSDNKYEGTININCTVKDEAGHESTVTKIIKRDITNPTGVISLSSTATNYNSNIVKVTTSDIKDNTNGSGIKNSSYYIKDSNSNKYTTNNNGQFTLPALSKDSSTRYIAYLDIEDKAGNTNTVNSSNYDTYKVCSSKTSSTSYSEYGSCSKTCGGGTKSRTKIITYKDSYTSADCGSTSDNETASCNTQACYSCPKSITIKTNNGTPDGENGWYVTKDGIEFNIIASDDSSKYLWLTDGDYDSGVKTITYNNKKYTIWGTVAGSTIKKITGEGKRTVMTGYMNGDTFVKCNSVSVNYDKTPPVMVKKEGGRVVCAKDSTYKYHNSWGYSVMYHDNVSGGYAQFTKYYSSTSCDSFWEADTSLNSNNSKGLSYSTSDNKIYSIFAGCGNNSNPYAKFYLKDKAGNTTSTYRIDASKSVTGKSTNICDADDWFTK